MPAGLRHCYTAIIAATITIIGFTLDTYDIIIMIYTCRLLFSYLFSLR